MRNRRLYLATRSERHSEPVLIWPAAVATARSAMVVSAVSPERWEMTAVYPAAWAMRMAARVSVRVPIWLNLIRMELATPSSMPRCRMAEIGRDTSELQSRGHLVCRLLLEKKNNQ